MEAELSNLENYTATPADGVVVAWPVEVTQPDREGGDPRIEFTVMAQILRETEEGKATREAKEAREAREEEEKKLRDEEEARLREEAMEEEKTSSDSVDGSAGRESEGTADATTKDEL